MLYLRAICLLAAAAFCLRAQVPSSPGTRATIAGTPAAIAGSKQDAAAVDRGSQVFAAKCAGCHGATAKGTNRAPDLVRSVLVLDDEKGLLIAPVIRNGRPGKGMPKQDLTEAQVSDVVAWLHVQTYAADHRNTYAYQNVVTGDAKKGAAYFNGAGGCSACHSATGDLKGLAARYSDPHELQNRWLQPRGIGRSARNATTVTVTLPSGQTVSGTLDRIDDFNVSLRDSAGDYRSFNRDGDTPKIELRDPLEAHRNLLRKYTDADIHNVTAYLVTLQ